MRLLIILLFLSTPGFAVNEYLQGYTNQCDQGSIEPYVEYNSDSTDYDNSTSYSDSIREGARVGIRFRFKFGSSCTDEHKKLMLDNEKLKQQLEVLKYCARYSGLELGDEFATIRKKCADVKKKESEVKDVSNESKLNR